MDLKQGIILADKGKSDGSILIDSGASEVELFAASQLQLYFQKFHKYLRKLSDLGNIRKKPIEPTVPIGLDF